MRSFLLSCLTLVIVAAQTARADVKLDARTEKAVQKALAWLARQQNADGSWSDSRYPHNTAITSFALLAFMSQGNLPNKGRYGAEVAKGARFLMAAQRPDGYIVGARGGNMYCHGMATLALGEIYGNTRDKSVKKVLEKAVKLIVGAQDPGTGGWRYQPRPNGADISVTIMQVMALRAAKNAGLHVPDKTMKRALRYINDCYDKRSGGFTYQPRNRAPGFARTAAGICVLYLVGEYNAEEIPRAVDYLIKNRRVRQHYWYGHYYAAHAMHQVGGKRWEQWYNQVRDELLAVQNADGSWTRPVYTGVGRVYQTSIAVIVLSVPTHYLPIFQR